MNIDEEWRWVFGYEGLYKVSNYGKILSVARDVMKDGMYLYKKSEKELSPFMNRQGYLRVILCKDAISAKYQVHRLVAQAFLPNPENKRTVNHKNGIKSDIIE